MSNNNIISIHGAREHNLKNISLDIPRDKMVVITGVSGSGKSSLAFDTIYAEGQRRYIESLSAYARQFLEQMEKPDVEEIKGLPPTISIGQRSGVGTPRSIVATTTEIYDYLRVLFARCGQAYCYKCNRLITRQSAQQIIQQIRNLPAGSRIAILAPIIRGKKGESKDVFSRIRREGFIRLRVDNKIIELGTRKLYPKIDKNKKHNIDIVVDRLTLEGDLKTRLSDSVELALRLGEGLIIVNVEKGRSSKDTVFSEHYACVECGISISEFSPRMFSFNSPYGACPTCNGLGTRMELDANLIVQDESLTLTNGAIDAWRKSGKRMAIYYHQILRDFARTFDVNMDIPFYKLPEEKRKILLFGTSPAEEQKYHSYFTGVIPDLEKRFHKTTSEYVKKRIHQYMSELSCPTCKGSRLKKEILAVSLGGKNIHEIIHMNVEESLNFFNSLVLTNEQIIIAASLLKEIKSRLSFLLDVGLSYLTLDRRSLTLAGGESQRIRLASQVGSGLVGVCYVLDEPTIGLHQRDNQKLLNTLKKLRNIGNSVIIVEHDEETIHAADYLIDIGPGAGRKGGQVVLAAKLEDALKDENSLTVKYLTGKLKIELPQKRRSLEDRLWLEVKGASEHNLKNIDVRFPLGCFCCVTGVSGSGKSTIVEDVLYRGLMRQIYKSRISTGAFKEITGSNNLDKVIIIDQSPIGKTPRSNPATYTGVFDEIRDVFAATKEARMRGYQSSRFSFNLKGGRCEPCQGQGTKLIEMHFLPDVYVTCDECKGKRYNRETLEVTYRGKNIADVLDMECSTALEFFQNFPKIIRMLKILDDVGLGYVTLGQSSITLSGGEAQRIKLAAELGKLSTGSTLYILDEPTTGLHFSDINKLINVLNRLVDMGNTVIMIEHNMDVIKMADYILDLGPEGGNEGGSVVAEGPPENIIKVEKSHTGRILKKYLLNNSAKPK
ncbi:MAG: excinuclease ABC subunit UvrA [Candidatus Brocadiia bacterium]